MGFLDKLFRRKKPKFNIDDPVNDSKQSVSRDENVLKLLELKTFTESLLQVKNILPKVIIANKSKNMLQ